MRKLHQQILICQYIYEVNPESIQQFNNKKKQKKKTKKKTKHLPSEMVPSSLLNGLSLGFHTYSHISSTHPIN